MHKKLEIPYLHPNLKPLRSQTGLSRVPKAMREAVILQREKQKRSDSNFGHSSMKFLLRTESLLISEKQRPIIGTMWQSEPVKPVSLSIWSTRSPALLLSCISMIINPCSTSSLHKRMKLNSNWDLRWIGADSITERHPESYTVLMA